MSASNVPVKCATLHLEKKSYAGSFLLSFGDHPWNVMQWVIDLSTYRI